MNESVERAFSQAFKNFRLLFKNPFRWFDVTLWPLILLFSITFFVSYLQSDARVIAMVILGVMGWRAVYHAQMEIASNYMEEYWSNSLTHLFITPIRTIEFVLGGIASGVFKFMLVFFMFYIIGIFLYGLVIPDPFTFFVAVCFLFVYGISLGMITLGMMFLFTSEAFSLSFTVPDIFVLISGVYYPITVLPGPVQTLAMLLPSTHAFNMIKSTLGFAQYDFGALVILSIAWFLLSYAFLEFTFRRAKKTGKLVRVA